MQKKKKLEDSTRLQFTQIKQSRFSNACSSSFFRVHCGTVGDFLMENQAVRADYTLGISVDIRDKKIFNVRTVWWTVISM